MMRDHGLNAHPVIISAVAPTKTVYPNLIAGYLWLDTTVPALKRCTDADAPTYVNVETNLGAPTNVDYLVGTASGDLSAEIVVGTSPGGELGGTWSSPTVDATHSGSSHANLPSGAQVNSVDIVTVSDPQTLTNKTLTAPAISQVVFPATQVPSADPNTLDDYEEGTWTPVLTFATPGDLSVVYSAQYGAYVKIGKLVTVFFNIVTSTFTHTTASGNCTITGLPFTMENSDDLDSEGALIFQGITKATYTQFTCRPQPNSTNMLIGAAGSGQGRTNVTATDMPSAGTVNLKGTVAYIATA